jgi:8-oxo-dGTP diphosphatase
MNITKYVAGFMFSADKTEVALIRKNKPAWQKGLLNGIGGKIEPGEQPIDAMWREFQEETASYVPPNYWQHFAILEGPGFSVDFFHTEGDLSTLLSPEEEKVERVKLSEVHVLRADMIENLPWLISLAIDHATDGRPQFTTARYP